MRRAMFAVVAAVGLVGTFGLAPASAATATPVLNVPYGAFQNITNRASDCAVVVPNVSYVIPVPAEVAAEVNAVSRYGYHSITGYALINGGAYPGQVLQANKVRAGVYPPHEYVAFVPGLYGRSCSEWVKVVAQG